VLRDDDFGFAFVQVGYDPIGIKGLVGDEAAELDVSD
jgi:hypothetical protein